MTEVPDVTHHSSNGCRDLVAAEGDTLDVVLQVDPAEPDQICEELVELAFELRDRRLLETDPTAQPDRAEDGDDGPKYADQVGDQPWHDDEPEVRTDGGGEVIDSGTPVGLDRLTGGAVVTVEYETRAFEAASIVGTVLGLREAVGRGRAYQQAVIEAADGTRYCVRAGGGIARECDDEIADWVEIGHSAAVSPGGERDV